MRQAAPPQRRIGLTGGIATGKSTVARLLSERFGVPVLDADALAREVLAPGTPGAAAVLARYGERVRGADPAAIDRAALGSIVFHDPLERRWLEGLIHPVVRGRLAAATKRLASEPVVVLMIPLLFEASLEDLCSEIWVVDCGEDEQLRRLMGRDGLSEAEARARIAAQWPMARKRTLADVVIVNGNDRQSVLDQLDKAMRIGGQGMGSCGRGQYA